MAACKHQSLEFVGHQKTDSGVNSYYKCKACGMLLVTTPTNKVIGIPGVHSDHPPHAKPETKS
jgi:hypothetical protein